MRTWQGRRRRGRRRRVAERGERDIFHQEGGPVKQKHGKVWASPCLEGYYRTIVLKVKREKWEEAVHE